MKKVLLVLAIVGMFVMPMMPVKGATTQPISPPAEKVIKKAVAIRQNGIVYFFDLWMDENGYVTDIDNGIGIPENFVNQSVLENIPSIINRDRAEIMIENAIYVGVPLLEQLSSEARTEVSEIVKNIISIARDKSQQILSGNSSLSGEYTVGNNNVLIEMSGISMTEGISIPLSGAESNWIHCDLWFGLIPIVNVSLYFPWLDQYLNFTIWFPIIWIENCTVVSNENSNAQSFAYSLSYDHNGEIQSADAWYIESRGKPSETQLS